MSKRAPISVLWCFAILLFYKAMADLLGGAALGLVFTQFWDAVKKAKDGVKGFKRELRKLEETLKMMRPFVENIVKIDKELDQRKIVEGLASILREGNELVSQCYRVSRLNFCKRLCLHKKLVELDKKILRFHIITVPLAIYLEVRRGSTSTQSHFPTSANGATAFMPISDEYYCSLAGSSPESVGRMQKSGRHSGKLEATIKQLRDFMISLRHVLEELESNSDRSNDAERLRRLLKEGEKLIGESSDIRWWQFGKKCQYRKKMVELINELLRFHSLYLQAGFS